MNKEIRKEYKKLKYLKRLNKLGYSKDITNQLLKNPKSEIDRYPKAKQYIEPFKEELSKRRECLNGAIPWFSLQWARNKDLLDYTPKIIIQNTRNERLKPRIVATVDEVGYYGSQGMNFIVPKTNQYSAYFLIGIINSTLVNYLFATKFLNLAIKADYIKQISFPKPSDKTVNEIETISKEILTLKSKNLQADTKNLEKKLDFAVYLLYQLTEDEIEIIETA